MFYLQSSLDVAYHISMRIYKLFNLASLPKNDFTLVLYCSMSILNQWNASIKNGSLRATLELAPYDGSHTAYG